MDNNKNRDEDAFDVMFKLVDENPDISLDEIATYLAENGYAKSVESVKRFYASMGMQ